MNPLLPLALAAPVLATAVLLPVAAAAGPSPARPSAPPASAASSAVAPLPLPDPGHDAAAVVAGPSARATALPDGAAQVDPADALSVFAPVLQAPAPGAGALLLRPLPGDLLRGVPVARAAPRGRWTWPLAPRPEVRRRFLPPAHSWSPGHRGVDLAAAVGQPVLAAGAGTVTFSGVVAGRGVVTVRHAGGLRTTYEPVDQRVAVGTAVRRGDRIGVLSAAQGHCRPLACLHWGAVSGQTYRDPLALLTPGHPVLLPLH